MDSNENIFRWVRIVSKEWPLTLVVPLANLVLIVVFWQSQIMHYGTSTQGVLFMWLVSGLVFVLAQMSLQAGALKDALRQHAEDNNSHVAIWSLVVQLSLFAVMVVYNVIALAYLLHLGVAPTKPYDIVIIAVLMATMAAIWIRYKTYSSPDARLLLATGTKAAPQWLQAFSLAIVGSAGLPALTMGAIAGMGTLRYMLTRHSLRQLHVPATVCANKAALRDAISIIAMCIGFIIGGG